MLHLHSKVVGDINAAQKKISKKVSHTPSGMIAQWTIVPTDQCEPFEYNRDTKASWCADTLAKEGAFNWQLFGVIEGIRNPETGMIEIWDGLGRLALAQYAEIPEIPVLIHPTGIPGSLFIKKQKLRNRTLNQESHFVSSCSVIEAGGSIDKKTDTQVKFDLSVLQQIKLRVEGGIDNYYPKNINPITHPRIKINALRRSLAISNQRIDPLKSARDMIVYAYGSNIEVGKELFEGLTLLFSACPEASKNGTYSALCNYLKSLSATPQSKLPFKKIGGNQHNDEARSVALGFAEMFKNSSFGEGRPSTIVRLKYIEEFKRPENKDEI